MTDLDPTKPVQTRNGRKARIICVDREGKNASSKYPIIALVKASDGSEELRSYTVDGFHFFTDEKEESENDLVNVPEERTVWVNVYKDSGTGCCFDTRELANEGKRTGKRRVAILQITIAGDRVTKAIIHDM